VEQVAFDPYLTLGVDRDADDDAIRRAYRRLAREYHPDLNKSPGAEERFKAVGQAYAILSDATRRRLFDRFGEASLRASFDPGQPPTGQPPREPAQPPREPEQPPREPEQPRTARPRTARPRTARPRPARPRPAPPPRGPAEPPRGTRDGEGGDGVDGVDGEVDILVPLEIDLGTAIAGGALRVETPGGATVTLQIPAAAETGHRLRCPGRGRPGKRGGKPGDLIYELRIAPHPYFRREGLDLVLELPVTLDEAHYGAQIKIPTPDGWVRIRVPEGSRGGEVLRLRGKGIAGHRGRGDLHVHLCLRLPERLQSADRLLERLSGLYSGPVREGLEL
jgi:DnaJ-class molecular chaperone